METSLASLRYLCYLQKKAKLAYHVCGLGNRNIPDSTNGNHGWAMWVCVALGMEGGSLVEGRRDVYKGGGRKAPGKWAITRP